jgi:hypothetical protein
MFGSILLAALVGCGGGGNNKPDAKIFLDAPIDAPPMCAVMASLGGLTLAGPVMNGQPTPLMSDWVDTNRGGALMGKTVISFGGRLPSSTAALIDALIVDYVKPTTGGYQLNTAIPFEANAASATAFVAASYVFGDLDQSAMTVQNFYWSGTSSTAPSGSVTFTQAGDVNGAMIVGSVAATSYREIDDMNMDVAGGCTTSLTGLMFNLVHQDAFQPQQPMPGGLVPLTADEWKAARAIIARRTANAQQ